MKVPNIFKTESGLTYFLYNSQELVTATILVLVKTGTDYENKKLNGISHFIEHLFFKGTKNFPSSKELALELDKIGADYNAFTSYEYTGYYIKTLPEYLERAIYLISDMLINPIFDQKELEKERRVIIEEINYHHDTPTSFVFDEALKLSYGDQPAGWSILGTKESLQRIDQKDILEYFKKNYSIKNTFVIVAGNFDVNKVKNYLNKYFKNYLSKNLPLKLKFQEKNLKNKFKFIQRKDVKQTHLVLIFKTKGLNYLKKRKFALSLLTSILGYGLSSRMFRILREDLGITYYVRVNNDLYTDRGYLYLQTGSTIEKTLLTVEKIIEELKKIKMEKIPQEEIQKSKALLETSILTSAESSLSICLFYGLDYLLSRKLISPQEYLKEIKAITENELKREIKNWLVGKNTTLTVLSSEVFNKKNFNRLINTL
ncbi:MAG: insulinase family protein [Patescibacteria group bacterium]|nr:insulinase family protein [Patescibacteria group bacterium]